MVNAVNEMGILIRVRYTDDGGTHIIRRVIFVDRPVTIGRSDGCKIVLDDMLVSNFHARLTYDSLNGLVIEDDDSSNGVYVNNVRIYKWCRVEKTDSVRLGNTVMRFTVLGVYRPSDREITARSRALRKKPIKIELEIQDDTIPRTEHYVLRNDLTVGRDPSCDVCVNSQTVSKTHARIINCGSDGVGIVDVHSSNGIQLGGLDIQGLTLLKSGDTITLGNATVTVRY